MKILLRCIFWALGPPAPPPQTPGWNTATRLKLSFDTLSTLPACHPLSRMLVDKELAEVERETLRSQNSERRTP